jgi:hypothetical protein
MHEVVSVSREQLIGQRNLKPLHFTFPGPGTLTEEHCCIENKVFSALENTGTLRNTYRLLSAIKFTKIGICISKQEVSCEGYPPATKWIVTSRYYFNWQAWASRKRENIAESTISLVDATGGCVYLDDAPIENSCTQDGPCFLADIEADGPGLGDSANAVLIESGLSYFARVKFYDVLPDDVVSFSGADLGEGCDWDTCGATDSYDDQFCVSVSTLPTQIDDCLCGRSISNSTETTVYTPASACCGTCTTIIGNPVGTPVSYCDGDSSLTGCILGCNFNPCDSYSITVANGNETEIVSTECGIDWRVPFVIPGCSGSTRGTIGFKTCAEDVNCYWNTACSDCFGPKYSSGLFPLVTVGGSLTTTCTFSPKSCCFTGPTWNVTFAF